MIGCNKYVDSLFYKLPLYIVFLKIIYIFSFFKKEIIQVLFSALYGKMLKFSNKRLTKKNTLENLRYTIK